MIMKLILFPFLPPLTYFYLISWVSHSVGTAWNISVWTYMKCSHLSVYHLISATEPSVSDIPRTALWETTGRMPLPYIPFCLNTSLLRRKNLISSSSKLKVYLSHSPKKFFNLFLNTLRQRIISKLLIKR